MKEARPTPTELRFPLDGGRVPAGMGDFMLISPDGSHKMRLDYLGEPPHGDSYHQVWIDGREFPGFTWGCNFAWTADSRYLGFSWMEQRYGRKTVIADVQEKNYFVLPDYIYEFDIRWPKVIGTGRIDDGLVYTFNGDEKWMPY